MTTQVPPRQSAQADVQGELELPEVLFEEARRRRRRRWTAGGVAFTVAVIVCAFILGGVGGSRGGGSGAQGPRDQHGHGPGASSGNLNASRPFPGAPKTQEYYTGPGASCQLAPRNRYLPAWSGCVSAMIANVSGDGHPDLVLSYSRVSRAALSWQGGAKRYRAREAMLRIVDPAGEIITTPIDYMSGPFKKTPARLVNAQSAALLSVAHVSDQPGEEIFLKTQQISSGSLALAYGLYHGKLVSAGVLLGLGGDSATQAGFQCVAGNPPRLLQHYFELIRGTTLVNGEIYGLWKESTATYVWHGPLLVKIAQKTVKRRMHPSDRVGLGCKSGIA